MKAQVKDFVASAREADFTVKHRERDGNHSVCANLYGRQIEGKDAKQLNTIAFKHNLNLEATSQGVNGTNFKVTVAASKPAQTTNVTIQRDAYGNLPRLPDYQYAIVKSLKAGERAHTRLQGLIDSGDVQGMELDLLEEQAAAQEKLNDVLRARINFYNISAYL
jgi:hypothetical protein